MKATIDTVIDKPMWAARKIFPDFGNTLSAATSLLPGGGRRETKVMNGGGNPVKAHTSTGNITVNLQKAD